jgi:AcrR family transcriptional regulator
MTMLPHTSLRSDPVAQRHRILEEAIGFIGQRGYHGFTIQGLAQRCGLTNGGLLYYFGSKEQLLVSILEERDRRETEIIPAALRRRYGPGAGGRYSRASVLQIFRAIMERSVAQPELLRLMIVLQAEALDHEHPAYEYFLRRERMVLDEFAKILASQSENPHSVARQVLALMQGLEHQWIRAEQGFDLTNECEQAIALILSRSRTRN